MMISSRVSLSLLIVYGVIPSLSVAVGVSALRWKCARLAWLLCSSRQLSCKCLRIHCAWSSRHEVTFWWSQHDSCWSEDFSDFLRSQRSRIAVRDLTQPFLAFWLPSGSAHWNLAGRIHHRRLVSGLWPQYGKRSQSRGSNHHRLHSYLYVDYWM